MTSEARRRELEDLLVACIDAADRDGSGAVRELLERHPDLAADVERILGHIEDLGLVDGVSADAPESLGGFRLLRQLGAGGMGTVYLARQEPLDRVVALKVLAPSLGATASGRERFRREYRAIGKLRHPHLVSVFDAGEEDGRLFYAMEYVPGRSLAAELRRDEPIPLPRLLGWLREVALALQCAHDAGVFHRDVKPSNILIDERGRAMLLDFGLAREEGAPSLSRTGSFQGSPHYAAPEQVAGTRHEIGPPTDVYGLGVTLFEAASGQLPFDGASAMEVFHSILHDDPPPLRSVASHLPRELEWVVARAMARDPGDRYRSTAEFAADLDALIALRPVSAQPPSFLFRARRWSRHHRRQVLGAAIVLLVVVAAFVSLWIADEVAADERWQRSREALREVETALEDSRRDRTRDVERMRALEARQLQMAERHESAAAWEAVDAEHAAVAANLATSTSALSRAAEALVRAEELAPGDVDVADARVRLAVARYRLAQAMGERGAAAHFRAEAERLDVAGDHRDELRGAVPVTLRAEPAGTELHLFRYRELRDLVSGGEPRLVAVPYGGQPEIPPGTWALRPLQAIGGLRPSDRIVRVLGQPVRGTVWIVRSDNPELRAGDRVLALDGEPLVSVRPLETKNPADGIEYRWTLGRADQEREVAAVFGPGIECGDARALVAAGGVAVEVWRDGALVDLELAEGVSTRTSASPLWFGPTSVVAAGSRKLERGSYVAVGTVEGREPVRVPFDVTGGAEHEVVIRVPDVAPPVPGFVPVLGARADEDFWILDHEVTLGEYLDFLGDPETLAEIRTAGEPIRYPRDSTNPGSWLPVVDRRFVLPWHYDEETPAMGVSLEDAEAFAEWATARMRTQPGGAGWRLEVPTLEQLDAVRVVSITHRPFVAGRQHRPVWVKSRFATLAAELEPVFRYPVDELPHGVFALSGSLFEWTQTPSPDDVNSFFLVGASWNSTATPFFRMDHHFRDAPSSASPVYGFRLVARPTGR